MFGWGRLAVSLVGRVLLVVGWTRGRFSTGPVVAFLVMKALRSVGNEKPVCQMGTNAKFDNPAGQ